MQVKRAAVDKSKRAEAVSTNCGDKSGAHCTADPESFGGVQLSFALRFSTSTFSFFLSPLNQSNIET